ncbi:MAG: hypothetical protein ACK4OO_01910 [bacterium]
MAFKPSLKKKRELGGPEVNLLPVMNLIIVLIPMLLSVAKLTELALLEYLPPAEASEAEEMGAPGGEVGGKTEQRLNLLVNLMESGIQVSMYGKVEPGPYFFEIPLTPEGDYDWETLNRRLWEVKKNEVGDPIGIDSVKNEITGRWENFPVYRVKDGREVSIVALDTVRFQTVLHAMDACRLRVENGEIKELFPIAILKRLL